MKPNLILTVTFLSLISIRGSAETPVNELMRDALYAEEVTRDADTAARQYSEILSRYEAQRNFAATALFRLAELKRKQGRKDEAVSLFQKLLKEFPEGDQTVPARNSLAALGGKLPEIGNMPDDEESRELARIKVLEKTSPDIANGSSLLTAAARANQLRVVTYLLERGANPNVTGEGETGPTTPLGMAASNGNLAMAEALVKAGASVEGSGHLTPMFLAIDTCRPKIIELLLKSGLDVNKPLPRGGPPLLMAIRRGYQPTVDLLLDSGADVNTVIPEESVNALHMAVFFENAKLAERLLTMGANPSVLAKVKWKSSSAPYSQAAFQVEPGDTPLMVAAGRGNTDLLEMMLPKVTEPDPTPLLIKAVNWEATKAVGWLTGKGADPNATTPEGLPLIILATKKWNPALIKALLDHGADPNVMFTGRMVPPNVPADHAGSYRVGAYSALRIAAGADISESSSSWPRMEVFRTLLDGGAKPDEEWLKGLAGEPSASETPRGSTPEMRLAITRRFIIPMLADKPAVILLAPFTPRGHTILQTKGDSPPMDLARLLLDPESPLELLMLQQGLGISIAPSSFTIWRKNAEGTVEQVAKGTLDQEAPFPALQWGDVVELSHTTSPEASRGTSFNSGFPDDLQWHLRRRISFPVSIGIGDAMETYQIRGDLLAFDPTKKELPWGELRDISLFLKDGPVTWGIWNNAIISRKGWPDIDLDLSGMRIRISTGPAKPPEPVKPFFLQPGDVVKLIPREKSAEETKAAGDVVKQRRSMIRIEAPGLPARKFHHLETNGTTLPAPTLVEVLADVLSSREAVTQGTTPGKILTALDKHRVFRELVVIWNHPDFANLRIRRLNQDGGEEILKVDLASIIAASPASDSPEQARAKDIPLQGGDILEVPLKGDVDGRWTGLSEEEASFFAKVLDCRVQFRSASEEVRLKEIRYRPLAFEAVGGGKFPFLRTDDTEAVSTTRVHDMLWADRKAADQLVRGQTSYRSTEAGRQFVRDGDQINWVPLDLTPPNDGTEAPKVPRPRVVAPSGSNLRR
ncbi:ankyrin repeat domain-containing protein [Luteolibacter sp. SL250]|uniref:ankyrin repeat domain-containing protein n=1 Tax=Luteolibacter sp. SL250 TaxID=2995170 RepID=UPI00226EDC11|nr:ankyrin repeat domain-containing protein [Luteolibacter sp. SL250]WAC20428.1 ankyrin repeat domain-containing protein [Luteolibacter sp. SL250]